MRHAATTHKEVEMPNQMNDTTARPAKDGTAATGHDGLVGVFQTLAEQHDAVAVLFAQLTASPESRAILWPQIRRELVSHEHSEVRELFPVLRQHKDTRAFADHHDEEARQLDAMIAQLDTLDVQSHEWTEHFARLVETVTHHAKDEEEAKIFPVAQRAIGEARAIELDAKVRMAKQKISEGN
jgi:hemerythrin superfamily protein